MGWCGADPLPGDVSGLTAVERKAYLWAYAEHREDRYPSRRRLAAHLRIGEKAARLVRISVNKKVGWPCQIARVCSGVHGLTPFQRRVLLVSLELWDRREYPSLDVLCSLIPRASRWYVAAARRLLESRDLFPCKIGDPRKELTAEVIQCILSCRVQGCDWAAIPVMVQERLGVSVSRTSVWRVLHASGQVRESHAIHRDDIETRKARVIADREGFVPAKLEEPAAYARACRRAKSGTPSSSRRVSP
jgi:hypothetical protein